MISKESQIAAAKMLNHLQKYLTDLPSTIEVFEYSEYRHSSTPRITAATKIRHEDNELTVIWLKKEEDKPKPPGACL